MAKREFKNVQRVTADKPIFEGIPARVVVVKVPRRPAPASTSFWELIPPEKPEPQGADRLPDEQKAAIVPLYDND